MSWLNGCCNFVVLTNVVPIGVATIDLFERSNGPDHGVHVDGDALLADRRGAALLVCSGAGAAGDGARPQMVIMKHTNRRYPPTFKKEGGQQNWQPQLAAAAM